MNQAGWQTNGRRVAMVFLAAVALSNGGCLVLAASAAGGAAVAGTLYVKGKVCHTFPTSFEESWAAARQSLSELQMPILSEEHKNSVRGTIESQTSDGTTVSINVEAEDSPPGTKSTTICVRVGLMGDYPPSDRIMTQIHGHLFPQAQAGGQPTVTPLRPVPADNGQWAPTTPGVVPTTPGIIPTSTAPPPLADTSSKQ